MLGKAGQSCPLATLSLVGCFGYHFGRPHRVCEASEELASESSESSELLGEERSAMDEEVPWPGSLSSLSSLSFLSSRRLGPRLGVAQAPSAAVQTWGAEGRVACVLGKRCCR